MIAYAIDHYAVFLLVLLRIVAFIGTSPVFSIRAWPMWSKLGLAVLVAVAVAPGVQGTVPDPLADPGNYIVVALEETITGMLMGFLATMIFSVTTMAGQVFDVQIGYSSASLFDPQSGQQSGLSGTFLSILFTLYFLGINGLDGLLLAVMRSYQYVALGQYHFPTGTWEFLTHLLGVVMALGIQLAAPLMVALLLTDITFAMLSRAVPQMNVFVVGQPAKLYIGLTVFAAVMPGIVFLFGTVFKMLYSELNTLMHWLGG